MKKVFLVGTCFLISLTLLSQIVMDKTRDSLSLIRMQEKQTSLETDQKRLERNIEKLETKITDSLKIAKDDTKSLLATYAFIGIGILTLIGFLINFLGKTAIKNRVEEIIRETAQKYTENKIVETLNSTLTNELIEEVIKSKSNEEIDRILSNIESQGTTVINDFKNRGDEILKLLLAAPPTISQKATIQDSNNMQINDSIQASEFFNLAFNSQDSRLQISFYKQVLELQPENVPALNNMGVAYNILRETKNAIEALTKAILLDDQYFLAFANRGNAYCLAESWAEGLSDLDKAIELNPKFYYAYSIKSLIYKKQLKFLEAEETLQKAIELNPTSAEAHFTLAFYYEEMKEYKKSLIFYEKASELNFPNPAMLFNNMAVLYRRQLDFDKALDYIEKAREANPIFPNLDGTMALIYADKNDTDNFYKHLKIALENGCPVWDYLSDSGFNNYRTSKRLELLIAPYKQKYFA